jgi:hypothetical protein
MNISKTVSVMAIAAVAFSATIGAAFAVPAAAKSGVNVRSGPSTRYAKVDALYRGEQVNVTECRANWCYVEHSGPNGWVSKNYLIASGGGSSSSGASSSSSSSSSNDDAAAAAIIGLIIGGLIAGADSSSSAAPAAPAPAAPAPLPYGPDTCVSGYVWRDAIPGDHVCVTPDRRSLAANENATAGARFDPTGAYGANSCLPGYVWREAYVGDVVCVDPARRSQVSRENRDGPGFRVRP